MECIFSPNSILKVMEEATNGIGFDLVISYIPASDEGYTKLIRDSIMVLGFLGTWVVISENETKFAIDPPETNLL